MSYNLGANIGAVEGGNPTGQVYSTKVVRTARSIGTCGNTGNILQYGCIFSRLNNSNYYGYATFDVTSPFALGTKPKHLTINSVKILTTQLSFKSTPISIGILIIPNTPKGSYNQDANVLGADNSKLLAYKTNDSFIQINNDPFIFSSTNFNQVVVDNGNDITSLSIVLLNLNTATLNLTDGAVFNVSLDYSFE
jgi:hypothetical protein